MKVGDLVKYRSYHTGLQDRVGCIVGLLEVASGDLYRLPPRVRVLWSKSCHHSKENVWDWCDELEVINESR